MARKPRLHYIGAVYHVMVRGNGGQPIFADDEDRSRFYLLLQEGTEKFGHRIHAFCLMGNHVHLAIQVGEKPLSRIMQHLCFRYTQLVNRRQQRTGHLFQGRYKAIVVDADTYLAEIVRYIHLNPVRAKLLKDPEKYPWSSHRAYMGKKNLPWLTTEWVLSNFALRLKTARARYVEFVSLGIGEGHREEFYKGTREGRVLGDDSFIEEVMEKAEQVEREGVTMEEVIERVARLYGLTEDEIIGGGKRRQASEARGLIAHAVRESKKLLLTELAKRMKRDVSSLSHAAERVLKREKEDSRFRKTKIDFEKSLV